MGTDLVSVDLLDECNTALIRIQKLHIGQSLSNKLDDALSYNVHIRTVAPKDKLCYGNKDSELPIQVASRVLAPLISLNLRQTLCDH
jgi:hypothetical protein